MRASPFLLIALSVVPPSAGASCFTMLDRQDTVVYQSSVPPIDLSQPISQEMSVKFPGRFLIFTDDPGCLAASTGGGVISTGSFFGASAARGSAASSPSVPAGPQPAVTRPSPASSARPY